MVNATTVACSKRFDAPDKIKKFDQLMHRIVRMEFGFKQLNALFFIL